MDLLQRRMQTYEYGLVGARGAVLAADRTAQRFSRENVQCFTSSFALHKRYPGSRGFGFVRRVPCTQEAAFVAAMRREYGPSFSIHEVLPALSTPAQEDLADRYVVQFVKPRVRNVEAEGLDLASREHRCATLRSAMLTGEARLSPPLPLTQAAAFPGHGFLLCLPVYAGVQLPPVGEREAATRGQHQRHGHIRMARHA